MKRSQVMIREFAGEMIRQDHKSEMFSATDMVAMFKDKNISNWVNAKSTEEFIKIICNREGLEYEQVLYKAKAKKGDLRGTWVHPLLAADLALWLSPDFKYKVLRWLQDNLCANRDQAGDTHKEMCAMIQTVFGSMPRLFMKETDMVQSLAGISRGNRNETDSEKLALLSNIQKWNTRLLERGEHDIVKRKRMLEDFIALSK